jgi:hypothetical protein
MLSRDKLPTYFSIGTSVFTLLIGVFLMLGGLEFYTSTHAALAAVFGKAGGTVSKLFATVLSGTGVPVTYTGAKALLAAV